MTHYLVLGAMESPWSALSSEDGRHERQIMIHDLSEHIYIVHIHVASFPDRTTSNASLVIF